MIEQAISGVFVRSYDVRCSLKKTGGASEVER